MKKEIIGDFGQSNICRATGKIMLTKREAGEQLGATRGHRTTSHIGRGTNKPKRSYYCNCCGYYHLTHLAQTKGTVMKKSVPYKREKNYSIYDELYKDDF